MLYTYALKRDIYICRVIKVDHSALSPINIA